jgi:hypothetical protein
MDGGIEEQQISMYVADETRGAGEDNHGFYDDDIITPSAPPASRPQSEYGGSMNGETVVVTEPESPFMNI